MSNRKYPRLADGLVGVKLITSEPCEAAMFFVNKLADRRYKVDRRAQRFQGFWSLVISQGIITLFFFSRYHDRSQYHPYQVCTGVESWSMWRANSNFIRELWDLLHNKNISITMLNRVRMNRLSDNILKTFLFRWFYVFSGKFQILVEKSFQLQFGGWSREGEITGRFFN